MHDALSGVLLALTIVIGVGVLVFIAVAVGLAVALLRARKRIHQVVQQYETSIAPHIGPMVKSAHALVDDLSPKLKHIAENTVQVSDILRSETQHITVSVSDVVERTHQQAARVDHIVQAHSTVSARPPRPCRRASPPPSATSPVCWTDCVRDSAPCVANGLTPTAAASCARWIRIHFD